jgi:hypothetical protein
MRKILVCFCALAIGLIPAASAHAKVLFDGSHLTNFEEVRGAAGTITEVSDPLGSGKTVFKTTVTNSQVYPSSPFSNPRADAVSPSFLEEGDEFWLKTKIMVPKSFPKSISGGMLLTSIIGAPAAGSPPWSLSTYGEDLSWQRNETYGYDIPWEMSLERENWIGIVLHERLDGGGAGWVEMWVNGEQVTFFDPETSWNPNEEPETVRLQMATMDESNNAGPNNAKIVQSRELGAAATATVYFGPLLIGQARADVSEPSFEGATIGAFPEKDAASGAITEVSDPLGSGEKVLSFNVHDSDVYPKTSTENPRAQLGGPGEISEGDEFWLHTKFLIPKSFPSIPGWMTLVTVYGSPFAGPAPWHLQINNNMLGWERNETYGFDNPWQVPLQKGKWTSVLLHERFDEGSSGWVEMWIDGEPITFFAPATSSNYYEEPETTRLHMSTMDYTNNEGLNNVRIAQYREVGMFSVGTLYFGPLRVGATREDVDF